MANTEDNGQEANNKIWSTMGLVSKSIDGGALLKTPIDEHVPQMH